jgi:hypothetical protein
MVLEYDELGVSAMRCVDEVNDGINRLLLAAVVKFPDAVCDTIELPSRSIPAKSNNEMTLFSKSLILAFISSIRLKIDIPTSVKCVFYPI